MKGIILAGGTGSRLFPITKVISKHLIPIYDKPMIYYPLSVLMISGIREILLITTERDVNQYRMLLGDGSDFGVSIQYKIQDQPKGIADAFIIGEDFIGRDSVCLVLGDNVFYGSGLGEILRTAAAEINGARVFGYYVKNPSEFGVLEFDSSGDILSLEEKPKFPKSHYAVPGLYYYDSSVTEIAKTIQPSSRGELEITEVNREYLRRSQLGVTLMGRGIAWLDTGTYKGLLEASNFVETVQNRQGLYIACIEEIAYRMGFIQSEKLADLAEKHKNTEYGGYLKNIHDGVIQ